MLEVAVDVAPVFERVDCEGVPEGAVLGPLPTARGENGLAHRVLDDRFVKVVTPPLAGLGIDVGARRGEDPLPGPVLARRGELAAEGAGKLDPPCALRHVALVVPPQLAEVRGEVAPDGAGKNPDPILVAFRATDRDLVPAEVDVPDAQAAALEGGSPDP